MKVVHIEKAETCEPDPGWKRASLCSGSDVSVEHFVKPSGHASPLHHHGAAQVCIVTEGRMKVRCGSGEEAILGPGDAAYFAPNEPHSVENARDEPSTGIDVFVPGRSFDFWLRRGQST
jgi:quercetin dioxygenase-like cupin family protein